MIEMTGSAFDPYQIVLLLVLALILRTAARVFFGSKGVNKLDRFTAKRTANLSSALKVAELGARRAPQQRFESTRHPATLGIRLVATLVAPVLFYMANGYILSESGRSIPADLAPWFGLTLLVVTLYYLIFIWTYAVEVAGSEIRIPTPFFTRRNSLLSEIDRVDDDGAYFLNLRFNSGRRAQMIKYVVGKDQLIETLNAAAARNTSVAASEVPKSGKWAFGRT